MATAWIKAGALAWLEGAPETRRLDTPIFGHPADGCEPLYNQATLDAAVAAEREACAKLCEDNDLSWADHEWNNAVADCATKIRARGELAKEAGNDFPKPRRQHVPCGKCHLQPGERCDICGAVEPDEQAKEK